MVENNLRKGVEFEYSEYNLFLGTTLDVDNKFLNGSVERKSKIFSFLTMSGFPANVMMGNMTSMNFKLNTKYTRFNENQPSVANCNQLTAMRRLTSIHNFQLYEFTT
ncbi:hypothetical protein V6M85_08445 [Sulfolobus tengchongensis]|uniref:Uncharacterized protein n=1 Tax=Sulfolobus tengchongensis TaxID=207809 RepID=A0AAX4KXQ1_9CREN